MSYRFARASGQRLTTNVTTSSTYPFSMHCWLWAESLPTGTAVALRYEGSPGFMQFDYNSAASAWRFVHGGNATNATLTSTTSLATGAWVHFAATVRSITNRSFWVNSVRVNETSTNIGVFSNLGTEIEVGHRDSNDLWDGLIAECFGWMQYELTDADVSLLWRGLTLPEHLPNGRGAFSIDLYENRGSSVVEKFSGRRLVQGVGNYPTPNGNHPPVPRRKNPSYWLPVYLPPGAPVVFPRRRSALLLPDGLYRA